MVRAARCSTAGRALTKVKNVARAVWRRGARRPGRAVVVAAPDESVPELESVPSRPESPEGSSESAGHAPPRSAASALPTYSSSPSSFRAKFCGLRRKLQPWLDGWKEVEGRSTANAETGQGHWFRGVSLTAARGVGRGHWYGIMLRTRENGLGRLSVPTQQQQG